MFTWETTTESLLLPKMVINLFSSVPNFVLLVDRLFLFFLSSNDILYETNRFILVRFVIIFDYLNNNHNVIVVALFEDDSFLVDVVVAFIARFGIIDSFG